MKRWWRSVRPKVLSWPIFWMARGVNATVRLKVVGFEKVEGMPGGVILSGWHGRTFLAADFFRNRGYWAIISQSNDGDLQNRIFRRFGFNTIRGSSKRGGVKAAIEAIKVLRGGAVLALTPDGPRGPTHVVQGGIMLMAQKSGAALIPVGVSAHRRWLAGSWDRYLVPWLFTRAIMIFGDPIYVATDADEAVIEECRLELQAEMNRLEELAEKEMGHL